MQHTTNLEEQLFLAALELSPQADRTEFLKNKCGDDTQLRNRVEELLAFHQRGDNILDNTSDGLMGQQAAAVDSIAAGTQIGPYRLLQEIGVGGMGVVFMAEQTHPVRRKVAVKIIKLGMDTRNVIARFEAERQALALMDHPNITKVFDAGITTSGRPYFVMELVTGLAITDYCDRERLSLRQRIELFHQVCVGIKHAHQKGIIHRDLKPSNVMVTHYDGDAVPKIIDFGIAKAVDQSLTDKTLFTSYGNMIGTPEYMSPEQAEMSGQDIDTRADVYSLGVLMYELLTGTTPFHHWKKKGIHKFCEAICHEEPELASTRINNLAETVKEISRNRSTDVRSLKRILRGDMDWILSKCMSKNRNDRYETAADLARDVKRYLDGQPIEAVGPHISYRARKFVRKHRAAISIAAVLLVTMCAATIVSTVFAFQATRANQLANNRLQEVDLLRKQAENERDRAQAAERELQHMERRSRNEAATARAIEKFNREHPNKGILVHYPARDAKNRRTGTRLWSGRGSITDRSENVVVIEKPDGQPAAPTPILEVEATQNSSTTSSNSQPQAHAYQIIIGDSGDLKISSAEAAANMAHNHDHHDAAIQCVVIQDQQGAGETKRFLKFLANEQRELFGPGDDMVANTLIEISDMSLQHQDWSHAENHLRECRDILKLHTKNDARMAKVQLMLSKALLNQEKTAAARETLAQGVVHLETLHVVPDELVEVMIELKKGLKEKNLQLQQPADSWLEGLPKKIEDVDKKLEIEIRKK